VSEECGRATPQPRTLIQPQLRNNAYANCVDKVCDEADYGADDDDS